MKIPFFERIVSFAPCCVHALIEKPFLKTKSKRKRTNKHTHTQSVHLRRNACHAMEMEIIHSSIFTHCPSLGQPSPGIYVHLINIHVIHWSAVHGVCINHLRHQCTIPHSPTFGPSIQLKRIKQCTVNPLRCIDWCGTKNNHKFFLFLLRLQFSPARTCPNGDY